MKFAENIRRLRKEKDISQEALAIDLDVSRQTISKWENGSAMPEMKKLTEIAEYFGTTMDRLLGLSDEEKAGESTQSPNSAPDYLYINSMLTFIEENEKKRYNKLFKRFIVILIVLIIAFSLTVSKLVDSFNDRISELSDSIINLQSMTANNDYTEETDIDEVTSFRLLGVDEKNPCIYKAKLTYEPESYPKNAEIYFLIPQPDGEAKKVKAENNNGVFTLTTDIDIMANGKYYVCVDDGDNVKKETINLNLLSEVFDTEILASIGYKTEYDNEANIIEINMCYDNEDNNYSQPVEYKLANGMKLENASLVAEANGKEAFSRQLYSRKPFDSYYTGTVEVAPIKISLNGEAITDCAFYVSFVTKQGVEFRYYPDIDGDNDNIFKTAGCYKIICKDREVTYDYGGLSVDSTYTYE